ncbi:unnamed protein product [Gongylonema pulchrum]|uniref:Transposase n=1 Tax=Gongylonema pulchrum TaxID=637853 RepID=A0A183ECT1_9BILA|nr:unnamed protein product [Gongylonema pulchrum]
MSKKVQKGRGLSISRSMTPKLFCSSQKALMQTYLHSNDESRSSMLKVVQRGRSIVNGQWYLLNEQLLRKLHR